MFQRLLGLWGDAKAEVPHFAYYLERHIELDGGSHGPWAREMVTSLAGRQESNWQTQPALRSAPSAVESSCGTASMPGFKRTEAKPQFFAL
jgi:hypothetical protein